VRFFFKIKKYLSKGATNYWGKVILDDPNPKILTTLYKYQFYSKKNRDYQDKKINFNTLISELSEMSNTDAILSNRKIRKDSILSATQESHPKGVQANSFKGQEITDEDIKRAIEESRNWLATNFESYDFINFLSEQLGNGDLRLMSIIEKHVCSEPVSGDLRLMQKFDNFCFKTLQVYL
jgi:hypothetical protein